MRPKISIGVSLLVAGFLALPQVAAGSGASLFRQNCAHCHGSSGKGDGQGAKSLRRKPPDLTRSRLSLPQIIAIVTDGKGACPSWKASMKSAEIKQVSQHAKKLQR